MTKDQWQQIKAVYLAALKLPEAERRSYVETAATSLGVVREVIDLLEADQEQVSFLEEGLVITEDQDLGSRLGPYLLERSLGRGGMSRVFLARRVDDQFEKHVAVKILKRGLDTAQFIRRFRKERRILAHLDHPNIARLFDGGTTPGGLPYFLMEWVENGVPITNFCEQHALGIDARLALFRKVCAAVTYAHQNLVVHRDLKPSNILVTPKGEVKLLDFGIAKLTDPDLDEPVTQDLTEFRLMTPDYASPEQIKGELVTTASDVYSLGVLLYELVTGRRPYRLKHGNAQELNRILSEAPPRPSTLLNKDEKGIQSVLGFALSFLRGNKGDDLDKIVAMAMCSQPDRRYASAQELDEELERYLGGYPVQAQTISLSYRTFKYIRRHWLGVMVSSLILAFGAASVWTILRQNHQISQERDRAIAARRDAENSLAQSRQVTRFLTDLFQVSNPSEKRAEEITARELLDQASADIESSLSSQPDIRARMMTTMAEVYCNLGLFEKALSLGESARVLAQSSFGPHHQSVAEALAVLAQIRFQMGDLQNAERLFRETIAVNLAVDGPDQLNVARAQSNLAVLLLRNGNNREAEQLLQHAKVLFAGQGDSSDGAANLNNLGLASFYRNDLKAAADYFAGAIQIRRRLDDGIDQSLCMMLYNQAICRTIVEEYDISEENLRQALAMSRKLHGEKHPMIARCLVGLGTVLEIKGQFGEAARLHGEAETMLGRIFEPDHPEIIGAMVYQGIALQGLGDYEGAELMFREVLDRADAHATNPLFLAFYSYSLGYQLQLNGKVAQAQAFLQEAVSLLCRRPDFQMATSLYLATLATNLQQQGEIAEAEGLIDEALTLLAHVTPENGLRWANVFYLAGDFQGAMGDTVGAERMLQQSLDLNQRLFGPDHPDMARNLLSLGRVLLASGRVEDAREAVRRALEIRERRTPDHPEILELRQLGEELARTDRKQLRL